MGSLSNIMSMIPGFGNALQSMGNEKDDVGKVKRSLCMLDSLTQDELDGKVAVSGSRITRIARGSGASIQDVEILLEEYKRMKMMVEKISKTNLGKGNETLNFNRN